MSLMGYSVRPYLGERTEKQNKTTNKHPEAGKKTRCIRVPVL